MKLESDNVVHEVMTKVWRIASLVTQFFAGDAAKAQRWLEAANPLLGNISPLWMLALGRLEKLAEFVEQQLTANAPPHEEKQAGSMRAQQPGWIQLGKTGDKSGRRQLWARITGEGAACVAELCAGREGDDAYVKFGLDADPRTVAQLVNVIEYVQYADEIDAPNPTAEPAVIICPVCKGQHIDRDEWATTRVHRTHLCEHCGLVWRPFPFLTVGVDKL